ncbi:MAG: hypothetical protein E6Q87_01625 [Cellvibrionales bacterium]|nr:MAG: hypothetical protein E6Q87_01625 [Cellvibrionales bacterium]
MSTLAHERFTRWQAMAISQLSVALALISSLSTAGLGACFSIMQATTQNSAASSKIALILSAALFLAAVFLGVLSVITRTLDFRLTARTARQQQTGKSEVDNTIWLITSDRYGRLTWLLFWLSLMAFMAAGSLLTYIVAASYAGNAGLCN